VAVRPGSMRRRREIELESRAAGGAAEVSGDALPGTTRKSRPRAHPCPHPAAAPGAGEQYDKVDEQASLPTSSAKGALRFRVNFEDYLDTGTVPRSARDARARLRERGNAASTSLNLFAYTGTATVYAAAGGAASSNLRRPVEKPISAGGKRNLAPQCSGGRRFMRGCRRNCREMADRWRCGGTGPTLRSGVSRSADPFRTPSGMEGVLDIERDHPELIDACARGCWRPGGWLIFSTNAAALPPGNEQLGGAATRFATCPRLPCQRISSVIPAHSPLL